MADQTIVRIPLAELDLDPDFNVRIDADQRTVEKYAESAEYLPPILVWRNPDHDAAKPLRTKDDPHGNVPYKVLDGVQRTSAFRLLSERGLNQYDTIPAIVMDVDRAEAQSIGMTANLTSGLPLNVDQRDRAVVQFIRLNPTLGDRETARRLQVSHPTILRIKAVEQIMQQAAKAFDRYAKAGTAAKPLNRSLAHGIAELPQAYRAQAAENVMTRGWTRANLRAARSILGSKKSTEEQKRAAMTAQEPRAAGADPDKLVARLADVLEELADLQEMVTTNNCLQAIKASELWKQIGPDLDAQIERVRRGLHHSEMTDGSEGDADQTEA